MCDFPVECRKCSLATGTFEMTKEFLDSFKCACNCASNCSFLDNAKEYIASKE